MKLLNKMNLLGLILVSLLTSNWVMAAGIGNNIVVQLVGTGIGYDGNLLFEDFGLEKLDATCFNVDLVDAKTGNVIGSAIDCLSDIKSSDTDNGMTLTGTTFFFFPGGTLISQGLTTVQPVRHGSIGYTHITGAVPSADNNGVIYGDGKFRNADGPVRLSGAVNLNYLSDGLITFNCVFIISI
jgi:hypothetical protein